MKEAKAALGKGWRGAVLTAGAVVVGVVGVAGAEGVAEARGTSLFDWAPQGFRWVAWSSDGCTQGVLGQHHRVQNNEQVEISVNPEEGDPLVVDISGKPLSVSRFTVCSPGDIIFDAHRDVR